MLCWGENQSQTLCLGEPITDVCLQNGLWQLAGYLRAELGMIISSLPGTEEEGRVNDALL